MKSLTIQSTHRRDGVALDVHVGHPGPLLTKIKSRYSPMCERKPQGGDTRAETSQQARTMTVGNLQEQNAVLVNISAVGTKEGVDEYQ